MVFLFLFNQGRITRNERRAMPKPLQKKQLNMVAGAQLGKTEAKEWKDEGVGGLPCEIRINV